MKLKDIIIQGNKKVFICSEGGTGKSSLLLDVFLYFSHPKSEYIPIYVPLKSVFEDTNDETTVVFNYILTHYLGYTKENGVGKLKDFIKETDSKYLILADGINEIPTTAALALIRLMNKISSESAAERIHLLESELKQLIADMPNCRECAVSNLLELADLDNVSVVVTSRYKELSFADFSQFKLNRIDEAILQLKIKNYDSLSTEFKELLGIPFNLSLYLNLSEKYKSDQLKTSSDLIEANINELKDKLLSNHITNQNTIAFLFDVLFPILCYRMSKDNALSFSKRTLEDIALEIAELLSLKSDEADADDAYRYTHSEISEEVKKAPTLFTERALTLLLHNAIIYQKDEMMYELVHENYRDSFGAKGWIFTAKRFKLFYKRDGEKLSEQIFIPPVSVYSFLKETVKENSFFDKLFDISTRNMLSNRIAAEFNNNMIQIMKILFKTSANQMPVLCQNFSNLDLSSADLCGTILEHCCFNRSLMNHTIFCPRVKNVTLDRLWNDNSRYLLLFTEGIIQECRFSDMYTREIHIKPFDASLIYRNSVYFFKNHEDDYKTHPSNSTELGTLTELDLTTLETVKVSVLTAPKAVFKNPVNQEPRWMQKYETLNSRLYCFDLRFDIRGRLYLITRDAVVCFSDTEYKYLNHCYFAGDSLWNRYLVNELSVIYERSDMYYYNRFQCEPFETYLIINKISTSFSKKTQKGCSFIVLKTDKSDSQAQICSYGPFSEEKLGLTGRIVDIRAVENAIILSTLYDEEVTFWRFYPENGVVEITAKPFDGIIIVPSVSSEHNTALCVFHADRERGVKKPIEINHCGCVFVSTFNDFICYCDTCSMTLTRLEVSNSTSIISKDIIYSPIYSSYSRIETQIDNHIISMFSSNQGFGSRHHGYDLSKNTFIQTSSEKIMEKPNQDKDKKLLNVKKNPFAEKYISIISYLDYRNKTVSEDEWNDSFFNLSDTPFVVSNHTKIYQRFIDLDRDEEDTLFKKGTKGYMLREKLKSALKNRRERLKVYRLQIVGERYILALASTRQYERIIDTLLFLDLQNDELVRIDNTIPFEIDIDDFIVIDSDRCTSDDWYAYLIIDQDNIIYILRVNYSLGTAQIVHQTEFYPDVWIENCSFNNVDIIIDDKKHEDESKCGEGIKAIQSDILRIWEENNITD